jgi:methionine synthase II (cobalamin-independent)
VFATLLGGLPRPPASTGGAEPDAAVTLAVRAQEAAGLEPLTDGRLRTRNLLDLAAGLDGVARSAGRGLAVSGLPRWRSALTVASWESAASLTERAVKQALPGPYTLGRRIDPGRQGREAVTIGFAEALREEIAALARAGCPLVEIEELDAPLIGDDETERRLFREAHRRMIDSLAGTHLSLSIVGGSAHEAGAATILAAPYASLAVDLIAGPDNWYLVTATPGDRGIVAGALSPLEGSDDGPELLLWAARYAASTAGRGQLRVGLATAGDLSGLDWGTAVRKLERLGEAARIAALPPGEELARSLDPRAIDSRSAALGRYSRRPPRRSADEGKGRGHGGT